MTEKKKFKIGLCMAGAVSAGAYTAGVMDYLIEALEEWEKRRPEPDTPQHEVCIPIMGGASAGGMTALLTATVINNQLIPVDLPESGHLFDEHPENKLYNSWVDLTGRDMFSKMLETDDIKDKKVISLLNSKFIDEVAERMLKVNTDKWRETPGYFKSRDHIPVKVFTTLTNLEGFSYYTDMNSSGRKEKYYMDVHNDYACFELMDGVTKTTGKAWMPLDFRNGDYLDNAKEAALATGAFPVGLTPRVITRNAKFVQHIPWLRNVFENTPLKNEVVTSLNIDGGLINNEPFEKIRYLLDEMAAEEKGIPFDTNKDQDHAREILRNTNCDYNSFDNTVLMIDPFPSSKNKEFSYDKDIFNIIPNTLSAMLSQMRAKPAEYKQAQLENDASSFIISPSRQIRNSEGKVIEEVFGERAIACGTFYGFGGFISKEFRIHDYFLGRFNCEIFLRDYFTVPASALDANPIFKDGYANVDIERFASVATKANEEKRYQIIPIFTSRSEFKVPIFSSGRNWPMIEEREIDIYDKQIRKRVEKILLNVVEVKGLSKPLLYIGSKVLINRLVAEKVRAAIKRSIASWKLLK